MIKNMPKKIQHLSAEKKLPHHYFDYVIEKPDPRRFIDNSVGCMTRFI